MPLSSKETIIDNWINKLLKIKVKNIYINTHYKHEQVAKYLKTNYGKKIIILFEKKILGTAGTLIQNYKKFKNDELIIIHGDNYSEQSLKEFYKAHLNFKNENFTMMAHKTDSPKTCGIIKTNKKKILIEFHEKVKNPPGNLANSAIYILPQYVLKEISKLNSNYYKDFSINIIPNYIGRINVFKTDKYFADIGSLDKYLETVKHIQGA